MGFINTGQVLVDTTGSSNALQYSAGSFYQTIEPLIPLLIVIWLGIYVLKRAYHWITGAGKGAIR